MYYIYRHILPNGKSYIGKTLDPKARYQNGRGYRKCPKFNDAIKEYGWNNIKHEILFTTEDECEARRLEKEMIEMFIYYVLAFALKDNREFVNVQLQ